MEKIKKENKILPKISIIVTSYNKYNYIKKTLQSILDQKYPSLEVIVIDDGSTDKSVAIINSFTKRHPHIFKVFIQKNQGQLEATNLGILKSTGEVLNFLNSDDYFDHNILLEVGNSFKDNSKLLWLTGYSNIVDKYNRQIFQLVTRYKNLLLRLNKYYLLLIVNYITFSSVFIKKSALMKMGKFSNRNNIFLEYELWLRLGKLQSPKVIKRNLVNFRLAPGNLTTTKFRDVLREDDLVVKKFTSNKLILFLHQLNNIGRIFLMSRVNL